MVPVSASPGPLFPGPYSGCLCRQCGFAVGHSVLWWSIQWDLRGNFSSNNGLLCCQSDNSHPGLRRLLSILCFVHCQSFACWKSNTICVKKKKVKKIVSFLLRTFKFTLLNIVCFYCLPSFFARWTCGRKLLVRRPDLGASPGSSSSAASYSFSHCRALPLGPDHAGLMWLLPWDAHSLLGLRAAREVFRSCLPSGISTAASLLWCGELRMSSQPQRCSLRRSHRPPLAGCLVLQRAAVSQLATLPTPAPARGGETLMARGRGEQGQWSREVLVLSGVHVYLNQVHGCCPIKLKFS